MNRKSIFITIFLAFVAVIYALPLIPQLNFDFGIIYTSIEVIIFMGIMYTTYRFIEFSPKINLSISDWKNKERKADFQISHLDRSVFDKQLFLFSVSFPKKSNAFLYVDVSCSIVSMRKKIKNESKEIDTPFGKMAVDSSSMQEMMNNVPARKISPKWENSIKDKNIRIGKFGTEIAYGFSLDDWGNTFSIYYPNKNTNAKSAGNYFGIGKHEFRMDIKARDFFGRLYVQAILYTVEFDGELIKTVSYKNMDEN